ncbi:hypothetical protein DOY81_011814 [Sarcophaga bullata]|nr:hypothetical protein DOY81_011814 [Sarcophaga bullata]
MATFVKLVEIKQLKSNRSNTRRWLPLCGPSALVCVLLTWRDLHAMKDQLAGNDVMFHDSSDEAAKRRLMKVLEKLKILLI